MVCRGLQNLQFGHNSEWRLKLPNLDHRLKFVQKTKTYIVLECVKGNQFNVWLIKHFETMIWANRELKIKRLLWIWAIEAKTYFTASSEHTVYMDEYNYDSRANFNLNLAL